MPIFLIALAVFSLLGAISFGGCGRPDSQSKSSRTANTVTTSTSDTKGASPTKYNIYIENSGSMKGYFSGKSSSTLETIIHDYYDRLTSENIVEGDTVTLNYINTQKVDSKQNITGYLSTAQSKCTEKYTKIDSILDMAMANASKNTVNIVISDYSFESDKGNYETAQSTINNLFTKRLTINSDLTVAILKYEVGFNGLYYPGGLKCKRDLPIYFWIFGDAERVKKVLALNVKATAENALLLQLNKDVPFELNAFNKRAIHNNEIVVKELSKERNSGGGCSRSESSPIYKFDVIMDLSESILSDNDIKAKSNYSITSTSSSNYSIESIKNNGSKYTFVITTDKPSPGEMTIKYALNRPQWVDDSNFDGKGIPSKGKTSGIKYLIGGVYDAYYNYNNDTAKSYFTAKINLK